MPYKVDLPSGKTIYLDNRDLQTQITLISSTNNQQQSQSNSLHTGNWRTAPNLFETHHGYILRIDGTQGQFFIQLQDNQLVILNTTPPLNNVNLIPLTEFVPPPSHQPMEFKPMSPMKPLEPMQPMKMGDMSMQMNPMEMRMGNMAIQMGNITTESPSGKRFCTQCGQPIQTSDRFCGNCGYKLQDSH